MTISNVRVLSQNTKVLLEYVGGMLKVSPVLNLDTFLNYDKPTVMVHGRNGFVSMILYDSTAERIGW